MYVGRSPSGGSSDVLLSFSTLWKCLNSSCGFSNLSCGSRNVPVIVGENISYCFLLSVAIHVPRHVNLFPTTPRAVILKSFSPPLFKKSESVLSEMLASYLTFLQNLRLSAHSFHLMVAYLLVCQCEIDRILFMCEQQIQINRTQRN